MVNKNRGNVDDYSWIPEGFVKIIGPNDKFYVVPEFYAPALQTRLDASQNKIKLDIERAQGTVSLFFIFYLASQLLVYILLP
jgi:hypothetical protein